jgi:hypothetical protein
VPALGRSGGFGGRGGGRGRFGAGQAQAGGRLQVAVYHTVYFNDTALVRPGGPLLDYLSGAPIGGAGGQYQQEVELQVGATLAGFGARISGDWRSSTVVKGGADGNLDFSDLATINLRLFENFGQQPWAIRRFAWLRGVRATLAAVNLFDARIHVADSLGATPLIYQPAYLDPTGRTISFSLRKLFY